MFILMQILVRVVGGLGAWMLYSHAVQISVEPASKCNAIIAQTRVPEGGNITLMAQMAASLPVKKHSDDDRVFSTHIWSPSGHPQKGNVELEAESVDKVLGKHMILRQDGSVLSDRKIPQDSLRALVGSKRKGKLVTEPFEFRTWMEALTRSVPLIATKEHTNISGLYSFSFRDYWNFEEAASLEVMHGSIRALKLRGQRKRPTELIIEEDGNCTMTDYYVIKGVIPLFIQWKGTLLDATISWTHTKLQKGWKHGWWGITLDRPPMAEMLRKQPWTVSLPIDDDSGELLVLERTGSGRLVFAKEVAFP
jgi:hypothetical protein